MYFGESLSAASSILEQHHCLLFPFIKMSSSLSVLVLVSSLSLGLSATWVDICDYQDSYGSKCCSSSMEQSEYYVVPFAEPWEFQQNICQ